MLGWCHLHQGLLGLQTTDRHRPTAHRPELVLRHRPAFGARQVDSQLYDLRAIRSGRRGLRFRLAPSCFLRVRRQAGLGHWRAGGVRTPAWLGHLSTRRVLNLSRRWSCPLQGTKGIPVACRGTTLFHRSTTGNSDAFRKTYRGHSIKNPHLEQTSQGFAGHVRHRWSGWRWNSWNRQPSDRNFLFRLSITR